MSNKKEKLLVSLSGGGPWGFRLQGGAGSGLPLVVAKVRRKSKSYKKLYEGDLILSVNDQACQNLTYDEVMDIADKSGTDLTLEVLRQESNKENLTPSNVAFSEPTVRVPSPLKTIENGPVTKEIISIKETTTKVTEEKEGLRIKSATLLPAVSSTENLLETFTSEKLNQNCSVPENKPVDTFPLFSDLLQTTQGLSDLQRSPADSSVSSSKTEEVRNEDNTLVKTTTETKHEVAGNTEMSFVKKEQQSVSVTEGDGVPSVTLDAIDLNHLISETQKRLESFRNGFKNEVAAAEPSPNVYEVRKTETTKSTAVSETKGDDLFSFLNEPPFSTDSIKKDPEVDLKQDLDALNGGLGFTSDETSCFSTETPFGFTTTSKKKKMFSSSSFYEEPGSLYPTVEEQVEMARKIADSLADDTNRKSKGSNMFYKRVKRSSKWIHEGPEPSDESAPETPEIQGVEPPTPDPTQVPFRPSKGPSNLKLVLDQRHPMDATALRSSGLVINEHNVVSPEVCHGIVKDLHSPLGKGAALFAKRKKKSEEWVVDEEKVKAMLREHERKPLATIPQSPIYNQYATFSRQDVKLIKTPWEAAMESPYGFCDAAFARVTPDQVANTVIQAADTKRRNSNTPRVSRESSRLEGCVSPPVPATPSGTHYDIYHAKAPKGWTGTTGPMFDSSPSYPFPATPSTSIPQGSSGYDNGFSTSKKMVFQNFNTVPRMWKGASAR